MCQSSTFSIKKNFRVRSFVWWGRWHSVGTGTGVGLLPSVWRFSSTPGLIALLMNSLVRTLWGAGCRECGVAAATNGDDGRMVKGVGEADEDSFLDHDITTYRRFSHVFRDLEYALQVC